MSEGARASCQSLSPAASERESIILKLLYLKD
jgi:hypothetical protein